MFYGFNSRGFVFSSQYNQISNHPFFRDEEINQSVLKLYISQHFIPPPFGLLKNTHSVFPGEIVKFDKYGKLEKRRYWSFPKFENSIINYTDAINIIECDMNVDFEAPVGYKEPERPLPVEETPNSFGTPVKA